MFIVVFLAKSDKMRNSMVFGDYFINHLIMH